MSDVNASVKQYFTRNLKKVIAKFGDVALLDEIAEVNLASDLATKINNKAEASAVTSLTSRVDTLVGNVSGDDTKSARAMAAEEVAKIVASAPDDYDTLKEIADWISTHSDSASAMNSAIVALQAKVVLGTYTPEGSDTPVEYNTVKAYVEAYVADQISNNITLASLSAQTTGSGNVVTAFSYDPATGRSTATKGDTAVMVDDLVDLTDAEVDALFAD